MQIAAVLLFALSAQAMPEATPAPAPMLVARAADPSVVGYFSATNGYTNGRTCDYPATVSTSGSYAQCCAPTGSCPFYTSCSGNTLMAGSVSVNCNDNGLVCNTAVLLPTAGANGGKSNLACWQSSLGSNAFSLVQDIGSATVVPAATSGSASAAKSTGASNSAAASGSGSGSGSGPSGSGSGSGSGTSGSAGSAAASSPSKGAAVGSENGMVGGGLVAAVAAIVQAVL